jgi:glutamate/tyrosine decarboxylase-like PLP-dependent enzyme
MNSDAAYATASKDAQKNLTLEFSRRARGIPIWAALASLGRDGLRQMIDRHLRQASHLAARLRETGFQVLNRVVLNQVLVRADSDEQTLAIRLAAQRSGQVWFGPTVWQGRPAFRLSICSWRTTDADIDLLADLLISLKQRTAP